jgi:NAD(P)-dependent dehydrogenase (short-subunit alcohol dehydrogenase family)
MRADSVFDVEGLVVAITGGAGVLCGAIARALAARGAAVALLDVADTAARELAEGIRACGGTAVGVPCNVLSRGQLEEAAERVERELGPTGVLINGAGGNRAEATTSPDRSFFDLPEDAVRWVFDLNFMGTLLACQVFGRRMAERNEGVIVNVSSMSALRPLTRVPAYSAAKSAVTAFTRWLAVHLNRQYGGRLRVNAVAPGFFLTDQNRYLLLEEETGEVTPRGRAILEHTPMGRFGKPEDLVGCVLWLMSGASAFVNGVVIPVDGGFSAFGGV